MKLSLIILYCFLIHYLIIIHNKLYRQSSGLSSVVHFVTWGCSSQSYFLPFHRHFTALKQKQLEISSFNFSCFAPHLHTLSTLHSSGLINPKYSFISFTLHSSSIIVFSPLLIWRLLLWPAIGLNNVVNLLQIKVLTQQKRCYPFSPLRKATFHSQYSVAGHLPQHLPTLLISLRCLGCLIASRCYFIKNYDTHTNCLICLSILFTSKNHYIYENN